MKYGIHYNNIGSRSGPDKVALNLLLGLKKIGANFVENEIGDINGSHCITHRVRTGELPKNSLLGPNLFVLPSDANGSLLNHYKNFVCPCEWVKNYFNLFNLPEHVNLHIWAVGIDTEKFSPAKSAGEKCLVYHKRGNENTLSDILQKLETIGIEYHLIKYGSYDESGLISACQDSKFAILNTSTESQGIAYQEILSMGVPCYVIDKTIWDDQEGYNFPATSVPYFDDRCGMKRSNFSDFDVFLDRLSSYNPREYIMDNLTLEKCASDYIKLLELCYDSER